MAKRTPTDRKPCGCTYEGHPEDPTYRIAVQLCEPHYLDAERRDNERLGF